ncbi:response regulator with CheY-like receiver, AAA-type ATPase, and DNA-binding domains [Acidovorax sp. CF316]|uniref:response regulator n=1 Tax=Acidovorax sp. CF316 TaxID=1144317 RepID=UPI00026BEDD5|nr:response regulator [Acidovorax sp. CF316]EJE50356.1 response regulator with CheY-like receiver, AAA-type ATPase, and DNA-binding domains [Acidovorax sp. CF316]
MSLQLLIVDDSRMSRLILQGLVLQAYPQWTILHAGSGEEALAMVEQHAVDIVSMDFNMHGMNGLEAALLLRKTRPQLPIAIVTANVQGAVQERFEEAGLAFIAKPITADAARKLAALAGEKE